MSAALRRSKGLPVYLTCPECDGRTRYLVTVHSHRCECRGAAGNCPGGRREWEDCTSPQCFCGDRICDYCYMEGIKPRVEVQGPDYIVPVLAVRMLDGDALCERHAAQAEAEIAAETVTEMA